MASNNFTDNDRKLLAAAWHCFETQPKVNFAKLAEIMGYKNAQTASACFGPVKKKLLASAAGGEGAGTPTPKKKAADAAGKGKGKRVTEDEDAGDDDDGEESPVVTKKAKKAKKAEAVTETKAVGEGEDGGEVGIKGEVEHD